MDKHMRPTQWPSPGFFHLCRETLAVCAANAIPLLTLAFWGFAFAGLMGGLIGAAFTLARITTGAGFGVSFISPAQYLAQGLFGVMAMPLAYGAITRLALQNGSSASASALLKESLRRLPALVFVWLGYGAVMFAGVLVLANFLRAAQFDLSNIGRVSASLQDVARAVAIRVVGYNLLPDPGPPFADALTYIRAMVRRMAVAYSGGVAYYAPDAGGLALPAAGAFAALLVFETLFRMRFPSLMRPGVSVARALADSATLGLRRFGTIAAYMWAQRLIFALGMALFVWLPLTVIQSVIMPLVLRGLSASWVTTLTNAMSLPAVALITMLFTAFSAVFDALLWKHLTEEALPAPPQT
ncbi:MAG TPA: hypothetical protein PLJ62_01430 [Thermoflexales bacterium]|nr:hypothetical protein [Thermoflexales bacterium]